MMPPIQDAEWPSALEHLRDGFAGTLNVYRVMAYHPPLLAAWAPLRKHVVTENALAPDLLEIVILRVGHRWASQYEWTHHVVRGLRAGLTDARIAACRADTPDGPDRTLLAAVDMLLTVGRLASDDIARLEALIGRGGLFDLMATVGMYTTLAFVANSFDVATEPSIQAELDARPEAF